MRIFLILGALVLVLFYASSTSSAFPCQTGEAQGFATIRWNPEGLISSLDGESKRRRWFWRRYNCTGQGVSVRRIAVGVYDVEFPGLGNRMALASSVSQEAVSVSVQPFGTGLFRVTTRGPIVEDGLLVRRDVPFAIVVY